MQVGWESLNMESIAWRRDRDGLVAARVTLPPPPGVGILDTGPIAVFFTYRDGAAFPEVSATPPDDYDGLFISENQGGILPEQFQRPYAELVQQKRSLDLAGSEAPQ